jgi:hypothetical protein
MRLLGEVISSPFLSEYAKKKISIHMSCGWVINERLIQLSQQRTPVSQGAAVGLRMQKPKLNRFTNAQFEYFTYRTALPGMVHRDIH